MESDFNAVAFIPTLGMKWLAWYDAIYGFHCFCREYGCVIITRDHNYQHVAKHSKLRDVMCLIFLLYYLLAHDKCLDHCGVHHMYNWGHIS